MSKARRLFPACRCIIAAAAALALSACASEDGRSRPTGTGPSAQATPGENKPYPNLASVPERPRVTPREERERIAQGLAADRAHANYSDEVIRRQVLPGDDEGAPVRSATPPAPAASPPPAVAPPAPVAKAPEPPPAPPAAAAPSSAAPEPPPPSAVQAAEIPPPVPPPAQPSPPPAAAPASPSAPPTRLTPATAPTTVAQSSGSNITPYPLPEPVVPPPPAEVSPPSPILPPPGGEQVWPPERRERSTLPAERPERGRRNERYMPPILAPSPGPAPSAPPILPPVPGRGDVSPADGGATVLASRGAAAPPAGFRAGRSARLATIGFASGSARLDRGDRGEVAQVASIQRRQGGTVVVVGHASREADDARSVHDRIANLTISLERANAVARALERAGVPGSAIRVEARGDSQPAVAGLTPAAEAANRRVEIFIDF